MKNEERMFRLLYSLVRPFLAIWHPFLRVTGRENIPETGCMVVANHSADSDPFWVAFAMRSSHPLKIMAKIELIRIPVLGKLLRSIGIFGVDRGNSDIHAVRTALEYLKNGKYLLVFPEGTRVRNGKTIEPKTGAAMFATRTDSLVLPIYVPVKKRPFLPMHVVIGEPYKMQYEGRRATPQELETLTADMMRRIYLLGETK